MIPYDVELDGETERYCPVWAGRRVSVISPSYVSTLWKSDFISKPTKLEESLNNLHGSHRVSQFSGLLLGVSLYSYHVRELLACWLFFCFFFVLLALVISGGVLVGYAGKHAFHWASTFVQVTPIVALAAGKLRLGKAQSDGRLK